MSSKEITRQFMDLFTGRTDAFGTDAGGCWRMQEGYGAKEITQTYLDHLLGVTPMGVYPMTYFWGSWQVKWGCVDLDVEKPGKHRYDFKHSWQAHAAAVNLQYSLQLMGLPSSIERTRSNGRHVWLFMADYVLAADMRRALLVACKVANVPPSEVNPKNEELESEEQLGNYVRLPYPGHLAQEVTFKQSMVTADLVRSISLVDFLKGVKLGHGPTLTAAATLYEVPVTDQGWWDHTPYEITEATVEKLSGLGRIMLHDGPRAHHTDRSVWLFRLALQCRDDGLDPAEGLSVVAEADMMHTRKFVDRVDGDKLLARTVEKAYAR